jgi:hypothetical protein
MQGATTYLRPDAIQNRSPVRQLSTRKHTSRLNRYERVRQQPFQVYHGCATCLIGVFQRRLRQRFGLQTRNTQYKYGGDLGVAVDVGSVVRILHGCRWCLSNEDLVQCLTTPHRGLRNTKCVQYGCGSIGMACISTAIIVVSVSEWISNVTGCLVRSPIPLNRKATLDRTTHNEYWHVDCSISHIFMASIVSSMVRCDVQLH